MEFHGRHCAVPSICWQIAPARTRPAFYHVSVSRTPPRSKKRQQKIRERGE